MADHLVFSLQPSPFLIFPCSFHRPWNFSRRFLGGIRFSVPEFRLSSQLQLVNSTSPSQSLSSSSSFPPPDSAPKKFVLVSSTQLKDGSHVFRFGDASEIERNLETEAKVRFAEVEKQQAKIAEKGSEVSRKQGGKDDRDRVSELEDRKERSDSKTKSGNSNIEPGSEKKESASPSSLSNVIKIKDLKKARSPTKKKKETSTSVNVLRSEDKVEAKIASVSCKSSIVNVAETIPPSSTEEKVVISGKSEPIKEKEITVESYNVEPLPSEVMEKGSVNELRDCETNGYQQITENRMEVQAKPRPSTSEHGSQSNDVEEGSVNELRDCETNGYQQITENRMEIQEKTKSSSSEHGSLSNDFEEVAHVSTIELDDNLDAMINLMKTFEAEENLSVEPTATAVVSPDELISTSEATHHSVYEVAETPVIDTSEAMSPEVNDGEKAASTMEDEITVSDTKTDDGNKSKTVNDTRGEDLQLSETPGLESIEVASGREELVSKAFHLDSGFASLQNPFKALAGREDAYFVSHNNWLGIADGVSQWSFEGINKGIYAQELMRNCQKIISDETAKITDPVQVLRRSVNETKSPGSSTALIVHLDNNGLHVANIGDSGFMVIRNDTVLQRSSPMVHHFCFPLQITQGDDVLKLAEVCHVNLEEGDVVVTATDGLFDNLYEKEIVSIICTSLEQSFEPQKIAELVAAKAQEVGRSGSEKTPFAETAKEEGYGGYRGGKLDAVTVIVSLVKTVSI